MPKISVIIPVYNTEPYLRRCLDSVVNQTLQDIELICVNDCSPDNALAILREYEQKDSRVKVIDFAQNRGVSVARNTGMDAANGEYIGFVDSDDYAESDFYEKLYNKASETGADIVKGNCKYGLNIIDYEKNEKIREEKTNYAYQFYSAIHKNSMLKNSSVDFPVGLTQREDNVFSFKAALASNKIEIVDDAYINITKNENSATFNILNDKTKMTAVFEGIQMILNIANSAQISPQSYCFTISRLIKNSIKNFKTRDEIKNLIAERLFGLFRQLKYKNYFRDEKFNEMLMFSDPKRLYQYLENPKKTMDYNYLRNKVIHLTPQNTQKVLALKNKHKSERCFIVGGSPSLNRLDLKKLKNETIFTVNRGFKLVEKGLEHSNYHVLSDRGLFNVDRVCDELPVDFADIFFVFGGLNFTSKVKNVIYFDYSYKEKFQEDLTKPLWSRRTVILFALQIAYYMGFNNIYLIGVDWDFKNFPGHAYRETNGEKERQITTSIPDTNLVMEGFIQSTEFLKTKGVNLYNASPVGVVDCISRVEYDALFDE